jgi:hypothetical protein
MIVQVSAAHSAGTSPGYRLGNRFIEISSGCWALSG